MIQSRPAYFSFGPASRGALFYLTHFAAFGVLIPFMNVYFAELGLNGRQIGLLSALFPATTLFLAPGIAAFADHRRKRVAILTLASLATVFIIFLFGLRQSFAWLLFVMTLFAIVRCPVLPIADGLIARMAARHQLNYGAMRLWGSFGFAVVAILCGLIWQRVGYSFMFIAGSIAFIPSIWLARQLEEGPLQTEQNHQPVRVLFQDKGLVAILAGTFLVGVAIGVSITFDGINMHALGGNKFMIGLLPALSAVFELPTMLYSNWIRNRLQGPRTLLLSYVLIGLACLGYSLAHLPWLLLPMAALKGLGFGLYMTSTIRLVDERVPEEWAATAQSLVTAMMMGLALLVASLLGGVVIDAWGITAVYLVGCGTVLLAIMVILGMKKQLG